MDKARTEDGKLFFSLTRSGSKIRLQRKPYSGVFYALACLQYSEALRSYEDENGDVEPRQKEDYLDAALNMYSLNRIFTNMRLRDAHIRNQDVGFTQPFRHKCALQGTTPFSAGWRTPCCAAPTPSLARTDPAWTRASRSSCASPP